MARSAQEVRALIAKVETGLRNCTLSPTDRRQAFVALGDAKTVLGWGQYDRAWRYAMTAAVILESAAQ